MILAGRSLLKAAICIAAALALSACSMFRGDDDRQPGASRADDNSSRGGGLFGGGGNDRDNRPASASTLSSGAPRSTPVFMPLASADPFGGVIITDWYADPAAPNERFKATVYILDTRLRADALNVSIFRQTAKRRRLGRRDGRPGNRNPDRERDPATRARQLRLAQLGN